MADLYTPASAPFGSFDAIRHYSNFLGVQAQRMMTWRSGLSGTLPSGASAAMGPYTSTETGLPIVKAMELSKGEKGDRIRIDRRGQYNSKPVMNDRSAKDRKEELVYRSDEAALSLYTHNAGPGGIMTRQRNPHDTRMDAVRASITWTNNLEDNLALVHAAGARGSQTGSEWIIPLSTDSDYQEIVGNFTNDSSVAVGNAVLPPSRSRWSLPGNATTIATIDNTDSVTLDALEKIRTQIELSPVPMQPVSVSQLKRSKEAYSDNMGLFIGLMPTETYSTLRRITGETSFSRLITDANTRVDFNQHPVFASMERFMYAGILWLKCPRQIIFEAGDVVPQYNISTDALENSTAAVRIARTVILGAQGLAAVYGNAAPLPTAKNGGMSQTGTTEPFQSPYAITEDVEEGGAKLAIYTRAMMGYKKLRYTWNGVVYDNGVQVADFYQPAL